MEETKLTVTRKKLSIPTIYQENYSTDGTQKSIIQFVKPIEVLPNSLTLVPKWLIVLLILGFVISTLIWLDAILVVVIAPRPGFYNESCQTRSCLKILNLKCVHGVCSCNENTEYYEKGCSSKKKYLENCNSNSFNCVNNLTCLDGLCKCNTGYYWSGSKCLMTNSYENSCNKDFECNKDAGLNCDIHRKMCLCNTTSHFWDGTVCFPLFGFNQTCPSSSSIYKCLFQGAICKQSANGITCQCPDFEYYNLNSNKCDQQVQYNSSCSSNDMCLNTSNGISCLSGICR